MYVKTCRNKKVIKIILKKRKKNKNKNKALRFERTRKRRKTRDFTEQLR